MNSESIQLQYVDEYISQYKFDTHYLYDEPTYNVYQIGKYLINLISSFRLFRQYRDII